MEGEKPATRQIQLEAGQDLNSGLPDSKVSAFKCSTCPEPQKNPRGV